MKMRSLLAAAALAATATTGHAAEFINVLTGGTSGVYYPLGVSLTQIYGKVMPDAQTAVGPGRARVGLPEPLEDVREEVGVDAGAVVLHLEPDAVGEPPEPHVDPVAEPVGRLLADQAHELLGQEAEVLLVRQRSLAVGFAGLGVDEHQVHVRGEVQLVPAELAHAEDAEAAGIA